MVCLVKEKKAIVTVVVSINRFDQTGYGITLDGTLIDMPPGTILGDGLDYYARGIIPRKYRNFDKPLKVEAGDEINFVCKSNNNTCVNTVASMIIELFI